MLLRSRLLREAVPPPRLTDVPKSQCEPRRRRRFPEEVMGDEHGRKILVPRYFCEEPSAAAGPPGTRPAAACRRGKCRRFRGDFLGINCDKLQGKTLPSREEPAVGYS